MEFAFYRPANHSSRKTTIALPNGLALFAALILSVALLLSNIPAAASDIPHAVAGKTHHRSLLQSSCSNYCSSRSGLYANPCDSTCTTFFNCANGITYEQSCGSGLRFNPSLKVCDWPANVPCQGGGVASPPPVMARPPPPTRSSPGPPPPTRSSPGPPPPTRSFPGPPPPTRSSPGPPPPKPRPPPPSVNPPLATGFVFSPYKDVTINMDWNNNVMSTSVTGTRTPVKNVMPARLQALTWAFATGDCGSETWAGISPSSLVSANVNAFVNAGKKYIISTGGAAGTFRCTSNQDFINFINRYSSSGLLGFDFDIEAGQSQANIIALVQRVKAARNAGYTGLRYSFTIATLATSPTGNMLNTVGTQVVQALISSQMGWAGIYVNLMVMDYGGTNCAVSSSTGRCNMGQSAINAARALNSQFQVPFSSIELTPMIGGNDVVTETFTLQDVVAVSRFVKQNGLGGVHFWSFDRDVDCPPGAAVSTCNSYNQAGTLGFTTAFLDELGL